MTYQYDGSKKPVNGILKRTQVDVAKDLASKDGQAKADDKATATTTATKTKKVGIATRPLFLDQNSLLAS